MGGKTGIDRTAAGKWRVVQEGIQSGHVPEARRRFGTSPALCYRWNDESEQGATAALRGRNATATVHHATIGACRGARR